MLNNTIPGGAGVWRRSQPPATRDEMDPKRSAPYRSLFQRHPLFEGLTVAELDDLLAHAKLVRYPARAGLFAHGRRHDRRTDRAPGHRSARFRAIPGAPFRSRGAAAPDPVRTYAHHHG